MDSALHEVQELLIELFGNESGNRRYKYIAEKLDQLHKSQGPEYADPYERLDGKIFAICYPDNIYRDAEPTLKTLESTLSQHFPGIGGIHILPERLMSHDDLRPQDLLEILPPGEAVSVIDTLTSQGVLDSHRRLSPGYDENRPRIIKQFGPEVTAKLDAVFNSHFNDGGFSQKSRAVVDPRFGDVEDVAGLTRRFAVMLDFVVNHLDIDNPALESYRRGESTGDEFVIISPDDYSRYRTDGTLEKTFRPRPFPLFTGLRKYPNREWENGPIPEMQSRLMKGGVGSVDREIIAFLSITFKILNDQGLSAEDIRIFRRFLDLITERGLEIPSFFGDSTVQPQQKVLIADVEVLLDALGLESRTYEIFKLNDDEVIGEKFYIYTTFSESQADVNPVSESGFKMVIDDLFLLLKSGDPAMLRMDAIKYLWKEIGKKNFDMEEGNILIRIIRSVMAAAAPAALPLDEINSPDPVVYEMLREGGFAYVFGQVNAVPASFNSKSLEPIIKFRTMMDSHMPRGFVPFVTLSTHDGRSVQGLGVDRSDGHVSIAEFYQLMSIVDQQGGKAKYRSVARHQLPADTYAKAFDEAGIDRASGGAVFTDTSVSGGDTMILKDTIADTSTFVERLSEVSGCQTEDLLAIPAIDFILQWIFEGLTPYELCCTSRDAFAKTLGNGSPIDPDQEAQRLALAQLYVLTLGQGVPAVYFNDLLGIENDLEGYRASGKPRDLNRKKIPFVESGVSGTSDLFTNVYLPLLNTYLTLRAAERAFYPGSENFAFTPLNDAVFCNHAYARNESVYVLGNISEEEQEVTLAAEGVLVDSISGVRLGSPESRSVELTLPPFAALWLKPTGDSSQ